MERAIFRFRRAMSRGSRSRGDGAPICFLAEADLQVRRVNICASMEFRRRAAQVLWGLAPSAGRRRPDIYPRYSARSQYRTRRDRPMLSRAIPSEHFVAPIRAARTPRAWRSPCRGTISCERQANASLLTNRKRIGNATSGPTFSDEAQTRSDP